VILPILLAVSIPLQTAIATIPQYAAVRAAAAAETPKKAVGPRKKVAATARAKSRKLALAGTAASGASSATIHWTAPTRRDELSDDLSAMLARAKSGKWGVLVVSLSTGDTLFGRDADAQMLPASTMKLFTSSLALDRFGADGKFETVVLRAGSVGSDGVLHGDLVLRGAGDPTLAGKALDGFAPCGPELVLMDEIDDIQHLDISTRLNGEVVQSTNTSQMIFSVADTVSYISGLMTLEVGDIIATGTPAGVGFTRDPPLLLSDGDLVEIDIERIGVLSNPVQGATGGPPSARS